MSIVTISPTFEIVIPAAIRERFGLLPGQKLEVIAYDGRVQLIPVPPVSEYRGSMKGIDTTIDRGDDHY